MNDLFFQLHIFREFQVRKQSDHVDRGHKSFLHKQASEREEVNNSTAFRITVCRTLFLVSCLYVWKLISFLHNLIQSIATILGRQLKVQISTLA